MSEAVPAPALVLSGLSKQFGGVLALDRVTLSVLPGEVHGLLGENGSGKSTVIKILAGFHAPDGGELEVNGIPVKLPLHPGQFRSLGLDFVHQDLGLITSLSVTDNLTIGELTKPERRWYVSWRAKRREARRIFERYGVDVDPSAIVGKLPPVQRALVSIVRAFEGIRSVLAEGNALGNGLLVLDEPTVFLPKADAEQLYALIRGIVSTGASVLFVSHDLDEVREITDRITVLRDGQVVGTVVTRETSGTELVEMIIGRRLEVASGRHGEPQPDVDVAVEELAGEFLRGVDLDLRRGEIVGATGVIGSGFDELPYLLFGATSHARGRLRLAGTVYDLAGLRPAEAVSAGVALIPGDRLRDGVIGSLPAVDNVTLGVLGRYARYGFLNRPRMVREAGELMHRFDVRPADPRLTYSSFSGGNQQKALLAKWLQTRPGLLLLHEPTQGVDVGARQQIFDVIRQAAVGGTPVVCASSDHEQLADLCDRVVIFSKGKIVQELRGDDVVKERITEQCYSVG